MVRPGFEPGTFCVLDRCDNQLRHRTAQRVPQKFLSEQEDAALDNPHRDCLAALNSTPRIELVLWPSLAYGYVLFPPYTKRSS